MLTANTHAEAAKTAQDALQGLGLPVHLPPIPAAAVSGPAAFIGMPEAVRVRSMAGPQCEWVFTLSVLVLGAGADGAGLLEATDKVCQALAGTGLQVTSAPQIYQPPNTPAALPAMLIRGE